jgi:hypothetical protein
LDERLANTPTVEDILAALKPNVDTLSKVQQTDDSYEGMMKRDFELIVRIWMFREAYQNLVKCVERIKKQ